MINLIHTGTFDVENYGDLLFPEIVCQKFPHAKIKHLSPMGSPPVWADTRQCQKLTDIAREPALAVIVGGGNIIHAHRSLLPSYRAAKAELVGYADLWAVIALAAPHSMPVVWNAPGVADQFTPEILPLIRDALHKTRYVSVRDDESRSLLLEATPELDVAIVPDSAWDLPSVFSSHQLLSAKNSALARVGANPDEPYLVFHVNKRYIKDISITHLAGEIDGLCRSLAVRPLFIGIGPCHDDDKTAKEVAARIASRPIVIDRPSSVREVAGLIANSEGYIGSSMHGYITAAAFGVPGLVIASGKHKFQGVIRMTGAPETLQSTWNGAHEKFLSFDTSVLSQKFKDAQINASHTLAAHWELIQTIVTEAQIRTQPATLDLTKIWETRTSVLSAQLRNEKLQVSHSTKTSNASAHVSQNQQLNKGKQTKKTRRSDKKHLFAAVRPFFK